MWFFQQAFSDNNMIVHTQHTYMLAMAESISLLHGCHCERDPAVRSLEVVASCYS